MVDNETRSVSITRDSLGVYTATNSVGGSVTFGRGDGLMSPVDLLLAAVAGCSAIDVDFMTSRRAEPLNFSMVSESEKLTEDGATRLENVRVTFDLQFPEGEDGDKARARIASALRSSHEKTCTVSRTIEHGTSVELREN